MWQLLKPVCPRAHAPQQREVTAMRYPGTTTRELPSLATTIESPRTATKTQNSQKSINSFIKKDILIEKREMERSCLSCINPVNICLNHCFDLGVKTA